MEILPRILRNIPQRGRKFKFLCIRKCKALNFTVIPFETPQNSSFFCEFLEEWITGKNRGFWLIYLISHKKIPLKPTFLRLGSKNFYSRIDIRQKVLSFSIFSRKIPLYLGYPLSAMGTYINFNVELGPILTSSLPNNSFKYRFIKISLNLFGWYYRFEKLSQYS